jgi:tetratricopeptide (TPR) repeat protein
MGNARPHRLSRRSRAVLRWTLIALLIHLVPLFLPRMEPKQELALARMLPEAEYRIRLLAPLVENPRSTPEDLRDAAELVLPASIELASGLLREAERRGSDPVAAELLRARIERARGDEAAAEEAMERARRAGPGDPRPDLAEARFRESEGDRAGAIGALQRAHAKTPEDVALTLQLARSLGAAHREEEGQALIDGLKGMSDAERWIERGKLGLAAGEAARAGEAFAEALALEPSGEARYLLGVSLFRLGDLSRAEAVLRDAVRQDARDFRALALLCALYREELRIEDAARVRMELRRRFPEREPEYTSACPP